MKERKKWVSAYLTVEASLIMSMVLLLYVFLIQVCLMMYDRCLLEQDMAAMLIKLAGDYEEDTKEVWQDCVVAWEKEAYLWIEPWEPKLRQSGWNLTITGEAKDKLWGSVEAQYEIRKLHPVKWLRRTQRKDKEKDS